VYPLICAAANYNQKAITWLQAGLGLAVSILLYLTLSGISHNKAVGFLAGFACSKAIKSVLKN
jgi:F0F1-type ATP synthase membrane subunit a